MHHPPTHDIHHHIHPLNARTQEDDGRLGGRHRGQGAAAPRVPVELGDDHGADVDRLVEGLGLFFCCCFIWGGGGG